MAEGELPKKRQLPKLLACMTKASLENMRNKALFSLDLLDAKAIRRRKLPLHECLVMELRESGYTESADYLSDLIYDNVQLLAEDDIGIVVDIRSRDDYLEHIASGLQKAERYRDKGNKKKECLELLALALFYSEKGKGILWLTEKFFLACIAVSSQFLIDGGRQKGCSKYHFAKFLLDKFPGADPEEPFVILTEIRDMSIGKGWPLYEPESNNDNDSINKSQEELSSSETLFAATSLLLHKVLLSKARMVRKFDPAKSERLSRLAERRAIDADKTDKMAEAIIEIGVCQLAMNNLNNAQNTFERAFKILSQTNNIEGLCECKMHLAAVMQRLGDYKMASKLLTEMGAIAMEHDLRLQLGRALHLLGELYLRNERPQLGTQHLSEAFACFMGFSWQKPNQRKLVLATEEQNQEDDASLDLIYKAKDEIYIEEAEQSRLMMAISAGQEYMASYFQLIREAGTCNVDQARVIEWKLSKSGWWIHKQHHDFLPCCCPKHNRTPLDVLNLQMQRQEDLKKINEGSERVLFGHASTVEDFQTLRSTTIVR